MCFPIKCFQGRDEDVNPSLMFHCRFSMVKMLEWREREHEDEDYIVENDLGMVNAL
jgi:hypothetical protein